MNRRDIEAIVPLTEMQRGFLMRHLRDPEHDDGFLEVSARFEGRIDPPLFAEAWARVVDRHEALRSSAHWPSGKEPLRIIHRHVALPALAIEPESAGERLPDRPVAASQSGRPGIAAPSDPPSPSDPAAPSSTPGVIPGRFALHRTPTWHLRLIRERDEMFTVVWTCHHVFVDGWSAGVVLDDLVASYNRLTGAQETDQPRPPAYSAYLRWLKSQDNEAARRYWSDRFEGFTPHALAGSNPNRAAPLLKSVKAELDESSTKRLLENGRSVGVPMGTLVQAAWALALGRMAGNEDICFGLTVSGRPAEVPGIESMAGMFMNALPLRVRIDAGLEVASWLQSVHADTQQAMEQGFAGPASLQSWARVSGTFFDSLLVFENYRPTTVEDPTRRHSAALRLLGFRSGLAVGVPLTLAVVPGERLRFELRHDAARVAEPISHALFETFRASLVMLANAVSGLVGDLLSALPVPEPAPAPAPPLVSPKSLPDDDGPAEQIPTVDDPTTPTEVSLALLVAGILSAPLPALDDDFFALGGDSMAALRLLGEIETAFGRAPSVEDFLATPTVRGLASALDADAHGPSSDSDSVRTPSPSLIQLSKGGSRMPMFLVHAGGGHVLFYHELARRLGADRPVYALQAAGLDGREPPLRSVPAMAERYLAEMRSVRPHGPYAIAGLCFGDLVALEIAHRLAAEGEAARPLIMFDSAPYHLAGAPAPERLKLGPVAGLIRRILHGEWSYLAARLRTLRKGQWIRTVPLPNLDEVNPRTRALLDVLRGIREAEASYRPVPYDGHIVLVRTSEMARRPDKAYHVTHWNKLALRGLAVETIEGGHVSLFEDPDQIDRLAAVLRDALQEADTGEEA